MARLFSCLLISLFLVACANTEQTYRRVPLEVRESAQEVVDQIMAGELSESYIQSLQDARPDAPPEALANFLSTSKASVRRGRESARNLLDVRVGRGGGGVSYLIGYEVETPQGFTLVSQTWSGLAGDEPQLREITIQGSDTSLAASQRRMGIAGRLMLIAVLIGGLLMGLAWRRTRRREA